MIHREKKKFRLMLNGMVMILLLSVPLISATHFTFRIPIELHDMHHGITKIRILCDVSKTPVWNDQSTTRENYIGGTATIYSLRDGSFNKTLTFKFNARANKDPRDAKSYRCRIMFKRGIEIKWYTYEELDAMGAIPLDQTKPIRLEIKGEIK